MKAEGVVFKTGVMVGKNIPSCIQNMATETIDPDRLIQSFDAVILACGAEQPRELDVPGADLQGVCFAMEYLCAQNRKDAGDKSRNRLSAEGKRGCHYRRRRYGIRLCRNRQPAGCYQHSPVRPQCPSARFGG